MEDKDKLCYEIVKMIEDNVHIDVDMTDDDYLDLFFVSDLGADSLNVVEIVMECETKYDVVVSSEEVLDLKTIGDLIELIYNKISGK